MAYDGSDDANMSRQRLFMRAAIVYLRISTYILIVGYNNSFRFLMKFHRNCRPSAGGIFVSNCVPSFMEMWRKYVYGFTQRL